MERHWRMEHEGKRSGLQMITVAMTRMRWRG
jgi:hypothetical protein